MEVSKALRIVVNLAKACKIKPEHKDTVAAAIAIAEDVILHANAVEDENKAESNSTLNEPE